MPRGLRLDRLGILWTLYFVQGLPFGFQATALPVYLRSAGMTLEGVGLATALALPGRSNPSGPRSSIAMAAPGSGGGSPGSCHSRRCSRSTCFAACEGRRAKDSRRSSGLVLAMNLLAATMDIAVDGFAVEVLRPRRARPRQHCAGRRLQGRGCSTGGGLLVWASGNDRLERALRRHGRARSAMSLSGDRSPGTRTRSLPGQCGRRRRDRRTGARSSPRCAAQ